MLYLDTDLERADLDCQVSWDYAMASGVPQVISSAYTDRFNLLCVQGDQRRMLEHARDQYEWSAGVGDTMFAAAMLASALLAAGDLSEAEGIVRVGLAGTGRPQNEASIRLCAGVLAARRGANETALGHLLRAREILPSLEERPQVMAGSPLAETLLAQDDPAAAFELVERVLPVNSVDPRVVDELMVWGARAAADLVQRASDDRDQTAVQTHREALARLVKTRAALPGVAFQPSGPDDTVQEAQAALFAAEQGRADGVEDQVSLWRDAVAVCADAAFGWEQQVATWRLASALVESGGSRTEAAVLLRGVHDYAVQQSAAPLQTRVEELAASARISLTSPGSPPQPRSPPRSLG